MPRLLLLLLFIFGCQPKASHAPQPAEPLQSAGLPEKVASPQEVHAFCGACHPYPPADLFPRSYWEKEVQMGYKFYLDWRKPLPDLRPPSMGSVIRYYQEQAPERLPSVIDLNLPGSQRFEPVRLASPQQPPSPGVANVRLVPAAAKGKLDILMCDMRYNHVWLVQPYLNPSAWKLVGMADHPAHAEMIDLDQDGIMDILVANSGTFYPTNDKVGSVVLFKGKKDGGYQKIELLKDIGRAVDAQVADFNGDGKLDIVVAAFGWIHTGSIIYLENQISDWSKPRFVPHEVDDRNGGIHVPVADLNGDGRPDFVALISQEHEQVVAFLSQGGGKFRKEVIFAAPDPAFGSSGLELVDLNGDGRLDVLLTNGDVLDPPYLYKPYHGVSWLQNQGKYPFTWHKLTPLYGAHRALALDMDGDGDRDIVATSFLPREAFADRDERNPDALIWLEQTRPGTFVRHSLAKRSCDSLTLAAGDWDGSGKIGLVTGPCLIKDGGGLDYSLVLWRQIATAR